MNQKKLNPALISIIVVVIIGLVTGVVYLTTKDNGSSETSQVTSSVATSDTAQNESTAGGSSGATDTTASNYADGTYTASGSYSTPGGKESVNVTITLSGGNITGANATGSATQGNSAQYQSQFLAAFKDLIIGKSVDEVSLSRVAGSSLTSGGFNKALETIKDEART